MLNAVRAKVSKNKRRLQWQDYDLDLTCILYHYTQFVHSLNSSVH